MSQEVFDTIDPAISGTDLATVLNEFKDAIMSGLSGTTRPDELAQGGGWIDVTEDPDYWSYKIWTGTADVEVFRLNLTTNIASVALAVEDFSVKKVSADTVGSILKLIKQRIANNGQVLDGDTVGEIQFVGRTDASGNPVVAKMVWVASDDQTISAYGGEFAFYSVADAGTTLTKHMRFINGMVEFLVPHKINSLRLVGVNVATTATIAQLAADNILVEMTGTTVTDIQGIKSDDDSQVITIHNRSTAAVTLKHQNGSASANDRMKLPGGTDYVIAAEGTATLYYCTTDTRWKLKSTAEKNFTGLTVQTYYGAQNTFTVPSTASNVRVRAYRKFRGGNFGVNNIVDIYGSAYAYGNNANGQLGQGDVTAKSSPVAVLGGLAFLRTFGNAISSFGIAANGSVYAWGLNQSGQLGVGDVTARSSPVAVTGGLKFNAIYTNQGSTYGITTGGLAYAWGHNGSGNLGVGDVTPRSAPVAVLGGHRFSRLWQIGSQSEACVIGLNMAGAAYAWGVNTTHNLGVGDATPRSSPVAVLGGLTFSDIVGGNVSSLYSFVGLTTSGAAYAWGSNVKGQLGTGDNTGRSSPVAVIGGLTFKEIIGHAGSDSFFGLTAAGALYAWGSNSQGILGVGDNTGRSSPVAVLGGLAFTKVRHLGLFVIGLTADGTAYAWGSNANGQLGLADVVSRSSPVAVLGGLKFFDVVSPAGGTDVNAVYGFNVDGTAYAWGANANGTLGLGDVTPRSSPVAVLGGLRVDTTEQSFNADLTVTPSASYTIGINAGVSYFGNNPLGQNVYKVEVEYLS